MGLNGREVKTIIVVALIAPVIALIGLLLMQRLETALLPPSARRQPFSGGAQDSR